MSLKDFDAMAEEMAKPTQAELVEVETAHDETDAAEVDEQEDEGDDQEQDYEPNSEEEKIQFLSAQAANITQPLMNMATRLIYEKMILGGKTVDELRTDLNQFKRRSKSVVDLDEVEYYSTVELVLFSFDQANIQPAEVDQLREAIVPVVRYYTKQKPSPFAPLMMFVAAKFIPIIMTGFTNRGKMRRKYDPIEVEIIEDDEA